LLVIASIHQPSTTTFSLFDKLLLLSNGRPMYSGPVHEVGSYFAQQGYPMPQYINPAEFVLELVNTDFATDEVQAEAKLQSLHSGWEKSEVSTAALREIEQERNSAGLGVEEDGKEAHKANHRLFIPFTLVHRNFIKSYRDIVAYGIRIAMYLGLAIMMGTVWLRLRTTQQNIESFTNAIFFGGAFMSFMAVAYIPSYLEDRSLYIKERANGLYGPTSFMLANFIIGLPFLCE
jgi:ABC-2 type transporter